MALIFAMRQSSSGSSTVVFTVDTPFLAVFIYALYTVLRLYINTAIREMQSISELASLSLADVPLNTGHGEAELFWGGSYGEGEIRQRVDKRNRSSYLAGMLLLQLEASGLYLNHPCVDPQSQQKDSPKGVAEDMRPVPTS